MDRDSDALNDGAALPAVSAAIHRELRGALAVEPSPAFGARLRERLAREQRPRFWAGWPLWTVALGAVGIIVLAVVLRRPPAPDAGPIAAAPPPVVASAPAAAPLAVSRPEPDGRAGAPLVERSTARRASAGLPDVEVIVPRGQADVIRRFADNLRDDMGNRGWIPVLVTAATVSDGFVFPSVPTIDRLPTVPDHDRERK